MTSTRPSVESIKFDTKIVYNPIKRRIKPIIRLTIEFLSTLMRFAPIAIVFKAFMMIQTPIESLIMNSIVPEKKIKMIPNTTIIML